MSRSPLLLSLLAALAVPAVARAGAPTLLHALTVQLDAKGGPMKAPEGVACTDEGRFVVADTGNGRLLTFTAREGKVTTGPEVKLPQLGFPVRVQLDSKGNLLVLDGKSQRIVKVDASGGFGGYVEVTGVGEGARVGAFKLDARDGLWILDLAGRRVLATDGAGAVTRQVPLPAAGTFTDIAVDAGGTLYAVDAVGGAIWSAGKDDKELKPLVKGLSEQLSFATYATVWGNKLVLVDQNGNGLAFLGLDGSFLGRQLSIGWSDGFVNYPGQTCITASGVAFVTDRFNNRVQLFAVQQ